MLIKDKLPIGEKVKYWRKKRDMTQAALAEKLMITPANISQIENGSRSPTLATMELIAKALEVDLEELVRDPTSPQIAVEIKKQPPDPEGLSETAIKIAKLVDQLPEESRQAVLVLLQAKAQMPPAPVSPEGSPK